MVVEGVVHGVSWAGYIELGGGKTACLGTHREEGIDEKMGRGRRQSWKEAYGQDSSPGPGAEM